MDEWNLLDKAREALSESMKTPPPPYRTFRDDARAVLEVGVAWLRDEGYLDAAMVLEQAIKEKEEVVE